MPARPSRRPDDWRSRALVAGFSATMVLLAVHLVGYAVLRLFDLASPTASLSQRTISGWLHALVYNRLTDPGQPGLYAAIGLQIVLGLVGAFLYAALFEPRLGEREWIRGLLFGVLTWVGTLLFLLPVLGAGFFGADLRAGPLPTYTTLLAHAAYGVVLGLAYAGTEDIVLTAEAGAPARANASGWRQSALGAAAGAVLGAAAGLGVGVLVPWQSQLLPHDLMPLALMAALALAGAAAGQLVGSLSALPTELRHRPHQ